MSSSSFSSVVVCDLGGYESKTAVISAASPAVVPRVFPNAITRGKNDRRVFIADQLATCRDYTGLTFQMPFSKGYLVNWDAQTTLLDYIWGANGGIKVNPAEQPLLLTEPVANLPNIQDTINQFVFEDYGFPSYCRASAAFLAGQEYVLQTSSAAVRCELVVDLGFSFTTVVPFLEGYRLSSGIRRVQVGGKLLTNYLKETISFRQWNMMDETFLVNRIKEACCFVSQDLKADLKLAQKPKASNPLWQEYVLPDQSTTKYGYLRDETSPPIDPSTDQILCMNNERMLIPEVLFHPSDIGINQGGLCEAIASSIEACPAEVRAMLYSNIVLIGGTANLPGLAERVQKDVRTLAPAQHSVKVVVAPKPSESAFRGGSLFSRDPSFAKFLVTKQEYEEHGGPICMRRFVL